MSLRNIIKGYNQKIENYLAPEKKDRGSTYTDILSSLEFSRALHFGSGRDKRKLGAKLSTDGSQIIAFDPDVSGLQKNQSSTKVQGDGERLPFENESFDLVFSEYVFEHLLQPDLALGEINRVLKPGGSFVVLVPNPRHYYARVADFTPFWFHQFWFKLQGVESPDEDRFPTQFEWGTHSDILDCATSSNWALQELHTFPGPTGYTKILPFHFMFVLLDRLTINLPQFHVCYIAHFTKQCN